jgi:hypothetical protein
VLPFLAWAHLELGEVERATSIVAEAIQLLRAMGMRVMLVNALRIKAMVAQRQGDHGTAETTLAEAVALADDISYPYAKAQALVVWARLAPEDEASQERLREAYTIFTRLGASADAARSERALKTRN